MDWSIEKSILVNNHSASVRLSFFRGDIEDAKMASTGEGEEEEEEEEAVAAAAATTASVVVAGARAEEEELWS